MRNLVSDNYLCGLMDQETLADKSIYNKKAELNKESNTATCIYSKEELRYLYKNLAFVYLEDS